jgi:type IV fimbrial biogenesis protein FimT
MFIALLRGNGRRYFLRAFTLIELLITLSIVSILMVLALPSWGDYMANQAVLTSINSLESSIKLARTAAVTDSHCAVVIRALPEGWQTGWQIFRDCQRNAQHDADEILMVERNGLPDGVGIQGNAQAASYFLFEADGSTKRVNGAMGMASVTVCPKSQWQHKDCQRLTLNATGRVRRWRPNVN